MRAKGWVLALCMTATAVVGVSAAAESRAERPGIGGVGIGDSEAAVREALGAPRRRIESADFIEVEYRYRRFTVGFSSATVAALDSTHPRRCTDEGLCPGDAVSRMWRLYPTLERVTRETGTFFEDTRGDGSCWYRFRVKGERVASVGVACQP